MMEKFNETALLKSCLAEAKENLKVLLLKIMTAQKSDNIALFHEKKCLETRISAIEGMLDSSERATIKNKKKKK